MGTGVDRGRDAFDRRAWSRAYEHLSEAARDEPLEVDDLERLASAAYLVGRSAESSDVWARAHRQCAHIGEVARAARCAFWLAFTLLNGGEPARGGGWVDRGQRLLDDRRLDCVEQGYMRYASALRAVLSGDGASAYPGFREAGGIGERFRDPELIALARIGEGRCLIYMGEVDKGVALLDEAMVAVGEHEVSPIAMGDAYCTVIEGCQELFDVHRVREWTAALSRWCDAQPDLVLYRGQCLIHRAELLQLSGTWSAALEEARRACDRLGDPPGQPALAAASYVRGDLHRLLGDFTRAEEAYRTASDLGRDPQPGLALLRSTQGRLEVAESAIRRSLQEADAPSTRSRLLGAFVEIVSAVGDLEAAEIAAAELASLATVSNQPFLRALAGQTTGLVLLARNEPGRALASLRDAWSEWLELDAPYEAARVRVRIALACRALGDDDAADMELEAARATFADLGAAPDISWVASLSPSRSDSSAGGLTPREREVLALVAKGQSNRDIAEELVISEKTVASHLSHIFTKLAVSSRTAASAFAYEHGIS
jgi:DNA-binding NarL/FixJ family response regulator